MLGPEFSSWPFKLHVIVMGISPWETTQVNWAKAPESITSDPKEKGTILGGSKTNNFTIEHLCYKSFVTFSSALLF